MIKNLGFMVLMSIALIGCSKDIEEDLTTGDIVGSVSDVTTGEPVAIVNVVLQPSGKSTVTGSDGSFSFNGVEPGSYTIEINKEGYISNNKQVTVVAGEISPVHILIERIPAIVTVDRDVLDFGYNSSFNTLSFSIVNRSYENLSWSIEENCDWITEVKPSSGVLKYGKTETIVVKINRERLDKYTNKTVLVVRSSNGSSQINIKADGGSKEKPYEIVSSANIMVMRSDIGSMPWSEAKSACDNLVSAGYSDWRLPTRAEIAQIHNEVDDFLYSRSYWTSERYSSSYYYYYYRGTIDKESPLNENYVIPVRTIKE
ncbi:MAG: DUF2012 domain-containing protein [Bacteroidales bacterium]|nr:DUF2012 domain-containing protein [Bacteroidales bacterium]